MSHIPRLEKMLTKAREVCNEAELRFATIDWEHEFYEMLEDDDYTPIPFLTDVDFYETLECVETQNDDGRDAKTFMKMMKLHACGVDPSKELLNLVGTIDQLKNKLTNLYKTKLREEFMKGEIDLRPSIYCSKCNIFTTNVSKFYEHECKETTLCNRCNFKATTYERLERHMEAKHLRIYKFECKECEYRTDSKKEYERHTNSKSHKENVGITREIFECKTCEKEYYFESEYKRHLVSIKHKKLCKE